MHLGLWGGLLDVQHELLANLGLAGELSEVEPVVLLADIGLEGPGEAAPVRTHKTFLWQ